MIPDQSSLTEHLRRAKYQAIVWSQCANSNIDYPDPEDYGLVNENGLKPCWFTCSQLPPSLTKRFKKGKKKDLTIGYEADTEESDTEEPPIKKSKRSATLEPNRSSDADVC